MMGMRLLDMEACDALDVFHVLLEEDSINGSQEYEASKRHVRHVIYGTMYQMSTRYDQSAPGAQVTTGATADGSPMPSMTSKPYIPPTDPSQLPSVLGPPMG